MQQLAAQQLKAPLWVHVADDQRFYAIGLHGLAWRLDVPLEQIHTVDACPSSGSGTCLEMDAKGVGTIIHWRLEPQVQRSATCGLG